MAMQRPGRPSTRLNQPAVNVPASKPGGRPATGAVPKQQAPAPATGRARSAGSSTRSVAKQSSSRPVPKQAAKSKQGKGRRVSGNPAKAAQQAKAAEAKAPANPFGNPDGEEIDYEKAAAALDLPKDFSKYLK